MSDDAIPKKSSPTTRASRGVAGAAYEASASLEGDDTVRERLVSAFGGYLESVQEISRSQQERLSAPYQEFAEAINDAARGPEAATELQSAYFEQTRQLIEQFGREGSAEARRAYGNYVSAVATTLAGLSGEEAAKLLPPAVLAGLGQHFLNVACWAAAADGDSAGRL